MAKGLSIGRCNVDKLREAFWARGQLRGIDHKPSASQQRAVFPAEAQWWGALLCTFLALFPDAEPSLAAGLFLVFFFFFLNKEATVINSSLFLLR